ncbi:MAG: hypothetical protein KDN05_21345 [Verrucomicrobiae bacterium]|nr:hypothetical protein [Verrucomicrobiae bacterium]
MKLLSFLMCGVLLLASPVRAEKRIPFPDLSVALKGGKLVHQSDGELLMGFRYEYGSDEDFEIWKKRLGDSLGKEWKAEQRTPDEELAMKRVMEAQGVDLVGSAEFKSPAFSRHPIQLIVIKEKINGKERRMVTLIGHWTKAQAAAGLAIAPEKKPAGDPQTGKRKARR